MPGLDGDVLCLRTPHDITTSETEDQGAAPYPRVFHMSVIAGASLRGEPAAIVRGVGSERTSGSRPWGLETTLRR